MKVWIKEPGQTFSPKEIDNTLEAMQETVGGYIEALRIKDEPDREEWAVIICNEEGRLLDLQPNIEAGGHELVGTIIICGENGDEFADAPDWIRDACIKFNRSHAFSLMNDGELFAEAMS